ncbi:MAG TPA: AarF/UbiB family protein [Gemmatimonadaceae bacterium]|nr:AarF/UbiB family protein [Gemmatimonadaceae bacterium]
MLLAPRFLPRLAATVGLFTRYGLHDFARRQGLDALVPEEFTATPSESEVMAERAVAFRKRLVELGPAYVKLGQVLSTRPDLLPEPYIEELRRLQDDVGAIPVDDVKQVIEEQLGARLSKLFAAFQDEPIGTGSLGQVHGAELREGRPVVVKVQRPGIRETLKDDLEFFRELARFLTDHTKVGHRVDLIGIIHELERALADELDYRIEAQNAAAFRRMLASFPRLLIPRVIEAYTSERVLTTERIFGVKIDEVPRIARVEHDFTDLADDFAKAYLKQITIDGHFHADPHPGNVFIVFDEASNPITPAQAAASERRKEVRPPTTAIAKLEVEARAEAVSVAEQAEGIKLALIDFGMTAHLSNSLRESIVRMLLDLSENRGDAVAESLIEMGQAIEGFDRATFAREVASLISRTYDRSVGEIHAGLVIYEMINISYERGLRLPAELTLLGKAMFNLDAVTRALDPGYSPVTAIREFSDRIASERARREFSLGRFYQVATQASDLISALPRRIDAITSRLANNELGLKLDAPQLPTLLEGMQKIANRVFSGLVLAGILVASAMLLPHRRQLGTVGFVIAGVIGVYMVVNIILGDRKKKSG